MDESEETVVNAGETASVPSHPRPTICLSMIVRDEAHIIGETLESVLPHIDTWSIVDTGSTDGTQQVIRDFFGAVGMAGELHERQWVDFGHNRTEALALARGSAEYSLVIDADDLLIGEPDLSNLTADAYMLRIGTGFTYWRTQLFRSDRRWEYRGVVHEYPVCVEPCGPTERLGGDHHIESRRLGGRNLVADKYERDSALLAAELERDPDDTRTIFYLAQSRMDAGDARDAYELYTRRAAMGGWNEEVYYSHLQRARALQRLGEPWERALSAYLDAWNARPTRNEALVEIARHYRSVDMWELAHLFAARACEVPFPEDDLLFVSSDSHRWQAADERAIAAFYSGRHEESFATCSELLAGGDLPADQRDRVLSNRDFCVPHLFGESTDLPIDVIERLTSGPASDEPFVTATITTCRRRDLFERTMDSFLTNCTDIERIDRWICIDDCSSEDDRAAMAERYPFFEFIWKDETDIGHVRSMQMLRAEVTSPYWLHLEDDWRFLVPDTYVSRALSILDDDPTIAQVLFNRNYAEQLSDRSIIGGEVRFTATEHLPYRLHTHIDRDSDAYREFADTPEGRGPSNVWWPHFSLRPSLMRTASIMDVGDFSAESGAFELDFAQRFTAAGLQSAFFDTITCLHLGPLTSDRGPDRRPNAYDLNGQVQFGDASSRSSTEATTTTTVRLVGNWADTATLHRHFDRQSMGDGRWHDLRLTDDADADVTVILNHPGPTTVDPERSIVIPMEPSVGVARWGEWSTPDRRRFLQVRDHADFANLAEWHLDATWAELGGGSNQGIDIVKTRELSTVVSAKADDPGQILRLELVRHLVDHDVEIDVFGRDPLPGVPDHRGPLPEFDKRDGLFPYRYTIAIENNSEINYVTEKLFDAILSECLCFYWGCPNLEELIDPDAFVRLPLDDLEESRRIIRRAIADNLWQQRLPAIRAEKQRILDEYQLFPTIERTIRGERRLADLPMHVINLDRRTDRWESFTEQVTESLDPALASRFRRLSAVDGTDLVMTDEITHLFRGNDFNFRRGIIACALSHLQLWKQIAEGESELGLIVEDDARFHRDFRGLLVDSLGELPDPETFDIAFLGLFNWESAPDVTALHPRRRWRSIHWPDVLGGTFGYLLSRSGARHLLDLVDRDGLQNGIDWFPMVHASEVRAIECIPRLIHTTLALPGQSGDSDIQHDHEPVAIHAPPTQDAQESD